MDAARVIAALHGEPDDAPSAQRQHRRDHESECVADELHGGERPPAPSPVELDAILHARRAERESGCEERHDQDEPPVAVGDAQRKGRDDDHRGGDDADEGVDPEEQVALRGREGRCAQRREAQTEVAEDGGEAREREAERDEAEVGGVDESGQQDDAADLDGVLPPLRSEEGEGAASPGGRRSEGGHAHTPRLVASGR